MKAGLKNILLSSLLIVTCSINGVFALDNFEAGKKALNNRNYKQAVRYFQTAINRNPYNVDYHYYYAQALVKLMDLDAAQKEYEKIIELAPTSEAARLSAEGIKMIHNHLTKYKEVYYSPVDTYENVKNKIRAELLEGIGENYINNALGGGRVIRWSSKDMPLKVFFKKASNQDIQPYYITAIKDAINQWTSSSNGVISYQVTDQPESAHIIVSFVPIISEVSAGNDSNFLGGLSTPVLSGKNIKYFDLKLSLTKSDKSPFTETEMFNTALHEIGHCLGIMGHSDKDTDIMYPVAQTNDKAPRLSLSQRDKDTLKLLYRLDIEDDNSQDKLAEKSEKNSVILGDNDTRTGEKLKEAKEYVEKVPNHPISWTSLGNAYYDNKQYHDAISSYRKALSIDPNYTEAIEKLANTYAAIGDNANAVNLYQTLLNSDPQNIAYVNNLCYLYIKDKKYNEAKSVLNNLLTKNPDARNNENIKNLINKINDSITRDVREKGKE